MKTRLTFLNTRAKVETGQTAHKTILKLGMGFGAEALIQQLIDKLDTLEESNQDLLQSNANLTERVEALEEGDNFPIKVNMVVMVNQVVTDMSAFMGYGIWARICGGRSPIGAGFTTDARGESITFTVGATGGRYKHVITLDESASHNHNYDDNFKHLMHITGTSTIKGSATDSSPPPEPNLGRAEPMQPKGGDQPHENTHPYQVFEFWQRTA